MIKRIVTLDPLHPFIINNELRWVNDRKGIVPPRIVIINDTLYCTDAAEAEVRTIHRNAA